jgi:hypothetical protein
MTPVCNGARVKALTASAMDGTAVVVSSERALCPEAAARVADLPRASLSPAWGSNCLHACCRRALPAMDTRPGRRAPELSTVRVQIHVEMPALSKHQPSGSAARALAADQHHRVEAASPIRSAANGALPRACSCRPRLWSLNLSFMTALPRPAHVTDHETLRSTAQPLPSCRCRTPFPALLLPACFNGQTSHRIDAGHRCCRLSTSAAPSPASAHSAA